MSFVLDSEAQWPLAQEPAAVVSPAARTVNAVNACKKRILPVSRSYRRPFVRCAPLRKAVREDHGDYAERKAKGGDGKIRERLFARHEKKCPRAEGLGPGSLLTPTAGKMQYCERCGCGGAASNRL